MVRTPQTQNSRPALTPGLDELDVESLDDAVVLGLLSEALRMEVWVAHAEALVATSAMTAATTVVCARPPELADLVHYGAAARDPRLPGPTDGPA